jgi:purine-binding chemotaxis protein CheW
MSADDAGRGERKDDPAPEAGSPGGAKPVTLMLLRLGQRWFAMDVRAIEEVALKGQVTRVPTAPSHILGVTTLRGRLVTVMSLEQLIGGAGMLPAQNSATLPRLVVVRDGAVELAVVAEGIHGMIEHSPAAEPAAARAADVPGFVREDFEW